MCGGVLPTILKWIALWMGVAGGRGEGGTKAKANKSRALITMHECLYNVGPYNYIPEGLLALMEEVR